MNAQPSPAQWQAAMKWFNGLSSAEMLAVRKQIPQKSVVAITKYWLANVAKSTRSKA